MREEAIWHWSCDHHLTIEFSFLGWVYQTIPEKKRSLNELHVHVQDCRVVPSSKIYTYIFNSWLQKSSCYSSSSPCLVASSIATLLSYLGASLVSDKALGAHKII